MGIDSNVDMSHQNQRSEYSHSDPQLTTIPVCYESNQSYYVLNAEEAIWLDIEIIEVQILLYLLFVMLYLLL